MKKKYRFISALICGIIASCSMSGCEKASERTIYLEPPVSESKVNSYADTGEVTNIGAKQMLEEMSFNFEGIDMRLDKKPYSDFKEKGWSFDPKLYGLEDLMAEIGNIYQRSIYLNKNGYDPEVFCIGVTNFEKTPCSIEDIQLWSVEFTAHEKTNYPKVIVAGGITWGSRKEDIIKAYGEPASSEINDDTGSTSMHYTDNDGNNVYFEVYDGEGVGKIILESYKL